MLILLYILRVSMSDIFSFIHICMYTYIQYINVYICIHKFIYINFYIYSTILYYKIYNIINISLIKLIFIYWKI